jgi:ATP-dependent Clp protease adapter protein ClpS
VNHGIKIWKNFSKDYGSTAVVKRDPYESQTADLYNYQRAEQAAPEKVYNKQCIVTCDPSKGLGGDYTVINVVEYPSLTQMMEFRSNISQTAEVYKILRYIWKKADEAGWECMFTVENNSVGEGIIILYETDEKIPNNVNMVSDSGKQLGMNTNARTKLQSCKTFKEMVEAGKFTINSADTIREIKTFVQTKGSYAAQPGGHDDTISAWLLVCRVLQEIASYDADAFQALYEVGELGDELVDDSDDFDDMPMVF